MERGGPTYVAGEDDAPAGIDKAALTTVAERLGHRGLEVVHVEGAASWAAKGEAPPIRAEPQGALEPSGRTRSRDVGERSALEIDRVMRERAPAGWKGDQAREAQVLNALFPLLDRNRDATRALFELVKNQPGY